MRKIGMAVIVAMLISSSAWAAATETAGAPAEAKPAVGAKPAPAQPAEQPAVKPAVPAAETTPAEGVTVAEAAVATGMENRQPVGAAEKFPANVGKLYCYTKLEGGQAGEEVVHKWLKDGETIAEVTLKVGGSPWRVYSSKTIQPEMTGKWSVEVIQGDKVLKTLEFTLE